MFTTVLTKRWNRRLGLCCQAIPLIGLLLAGSVSCTTSSETSVKTTAVDVTNNLDEMYVDPWLERLVTSLGGSRSDVPTFLADSLVLAGEVDERLVGRAEEVVQGRQLERAIYSFLDEIRLGQTGLRDLGLSRESVQAAYENWDLRLPDVVDLREVARAVGLVDAQGIPLWQPLASLTHAEGLSFNDEPLDLAAIEELARRYLADLAIYPYEEWAYLATLGFTPPPEPPSGYGASPTEIALFLNDLDPSANARIRQIGNNGNYNGTTMAEAGAPITGLFDSIAITVLGTEEISADGRSYICRWTFCWVSINFSGLATTSGQPDLRCIDVEGILGRFTTDDVPRGILPHQIAFEDAYCA